ncbi:hypothetical protein HanIR_Chr09g0399961 [Helianthus annuus]|nr:hypothetical protein HanIR_Chr09g0399961 [Helianthus annuus]
MYRLSASWQGNQSAWFCERLFHNATDRFAAMADLSFFVLLFTDLSLVYVIIFSDFVSV